MPSMVTGFELAILWTFGLACIVGAVAWGIVRWIRGDDEVQRENDGSDPS